LRLRGRGGHGPDRCARADRRVAARGRDAHRADRGCWRGPGCSRDPDVGHGACARWCRAGRRRMTTGLEPRPELETERDFDAIVVDAAPEGPAAMTPVELSVGRGVIVDVARQAALEIPDVLRVARRGPRWRAALAGP